MPSRKPTAVHELSGAYRKNPQRGRARANEPAPKAGIGPAPGHLSEVESQCWDELVNIAPNGVMYDSDRVHLELTAKLLAYVRAQGIEGTSPQLLNRLSVCLGKLGLTPADRSSIVVDDRHTANPFARL